MDSEAADGLDDFLKRTAVEETGSVSEGEAPDVQRSGETVVLKILIPEKETGHVIGKAGSVLNKIKEASNTRIRISAMDEVIPMTRERICTIVGTLPSVLLAQKLISTALVENSKPLIDEPVGSHRTLKLLLSHAAVGCVIGRGAPLPMPLSRDRAASALLPRSTLCVLTAPHRGARRLAHQGDDDADWCGHQGVATLRAHPGVDRASAQIAGQRHRANTRHQPHPWPPACIPRGPRRQKAPRKRHALGSLWSSNAAHIPVGDVIDRPTCAPMVGWQNTPNETPRTHPLLRTRWLVGRPHVQPRPPARKKRKLPLPTTR